MKAIVRGFQPIDYTKKDGTHIKGITLKLSFNSGDVIGEDVKEEFVSVNTPVYKTLLPFLDGSRDMDDLIGSKVFIDYNVVDRGSYTRKSIVDFEIIGAAE